MKGKISRVAAELLMAAWLNDLYEDRREAERVAREMADDMERDGSVFSLDDGNEIVHEQDGFYLKDVSEEERRFEEALETWRKCGFRQQHLM